MRHPDDCDCGAEHGAAIVSGLNRSWGRHRRRNAVLTLLAVAAFVTVSLLLV